MAKIHISVSDELLSYVERKVDNPDALIVSLLERWRQQQEDAALATACVLVDELELGWESECQEAAAMDWEASGL